MKAHKVVASLVGGYGCSLIIAVVLTLIAAAVTEHWGAQQTGNALMALFGATGLLFLLSAIAVYLVLVRIEVKLLPRLAIIAGYLLALGATGLLFAFLTMVIFNR